MTTIYCKCPHCGSTELRSMDHIIATCDVDSWELIDGKLVPEFSGSGSDLHWDSCEPLDKSKPYECGACFTSLSEDEIVRCETADA